MPAGGPTIRLATRAMACEFSVIMNAGATDDVLHATEALDVIPRLEQQMSVYREDSELSQLNRLACDKDVPVEPRLLELLLEAKRMSQLTDGAFDPTSGPLVALWRDCRPRGGFPIKASSTGALAS